MQMKTLEPEKVRYVYYSIRERLAFFELAKHLKLKVTHVSDEDGYEKWDVIYRKEETTAVAEIKVRRKASTDHPDWIFEKLKYDGLYEVVNSVGKIKVKPVFVVFFTDCTYIWQVDKINKNTFFKQNLRATSINGSLDTKDKDVTYLKLEDGHRIDYIVDMDKLNLNAKTVFAYKYTNNTSQIINL